MPKNTLAFGKMLQVILCFLSLFSASGVKESHYSLGLSTKKNNSNYVPHVCHSRCFHLWKVPKHQNWTALALHVYSCITFLTNSYALWRGHLHNLNKAKPLLAPLLRRNCNPLFFPDEATSCWDFSGALMMEPEFSVETTTGMLFKLCQWLIMVSYVIPSCKMDKMVFINSCRVLWDLCW